MERLTKKEKLKLSHGKELIICKHKESDCNDSCMSIRPCKWYEKVQERLWEYENAEEQGLLLRLPCKIGSTLYQPISNRINEYKAIGLCFDITRNEFMYEVAYQIGLEWHKTTCDFDCINKTVFLTKEEAEQALKQMGE